MSKDYHHQPLNHLNHGYIRPYKVLAQLCYIYTTVGLSARCPYVGCVLVRRHRVNRVNWARTHQRWLRQQ